MNEGVTPVTVTTTNIGYDYTYAGSSPNAALTYQVNLTPNIVLRLSASSFDVGNDEVAWNMGYRNIKFSILIQLLPTGIRTMTGLYSVTPIFS